MRKKRRDRPGGNTGPEREAKLPKVLEMILSLFFLLGVELVLSVFEKDIEGCHRSVTA
jgi:hypothetical protein